MGKTHDAKGVSLTSQQWAFVAGRVRFLKLRGTSEYFQLLTEFDRRWELGKHLHQVDNDVHLYPEGAALEWGPAEVCTVGPEAATIAAEGPQAGYGKKDVVRKIWPRKSGAARSPRKCSGSDASLSRDNAC